MPRAIILRAEHAFGKPHGSGNEGAVASNMALVAFIVRVFSAAIAFFSHILFARIIGQFDYGIYAFVWVLCIIFGNLSCLGFHSTLIRYLPKYQADDDYDAYRGLVSRARVIAFTAGSLFALCSAGLILAFKASIESYYLIPLVIALFIVPIIALGDMADGLARANGWSLPAMQYTYLLRPMLIVATMLIFSAFGANPSAALALLSALIATYLTTLIQYLGLRRRITPIKREGPKAYHQRLWLSFALAMFCIDGIGFLLTNADVVIVGIIMAPDDVAIYFAAAKTIVLMQFVFFAVKAAAGPRLAKLIAEHKDQATGHAARQMASWSFWPSLIIGLVLLGAGPWLLTLFGQGFASGQSLLTILFIGFLCKAAIGPAETLLNMSGKQSLCLKLYVITFAANIILNLILIPAYGLEGAALATTMAMILETALLFTATYKTLNIVLMPFSIGKNQQRDGGQNGQ